MEVVRLGIEAEKRPTMKQSIVSVPWQLHAPNNVVL